MDNHSPQEPAAKLPPDHLRTYLGHFIVIRNRAIGAHKPQCMSGIVETVDRNGWVQMRMYVSESSPRGMLVGQFLPEAEVLAVEGIYREFLPIRNKQKESVPA